MLRPLFALFLIVVPAFAQDIELKPHLRVGDTFVMQITKTHDDSQRAQSNRKTRAMVNYKVLEADPKTGFLLDITVGEPEILESGQTLNPIAVELSKAAAQIHFKVRLAEGGNIRGVENQEEVAEQFKGILDKLRKAILAEMPEAQREQYDKSMQASLQPASATKASLEEVSMYFNLDSVPLSVGHPKQTEITQASPFNGAPIPTIVQIDMTKADAASAEITLKSRPSPAAMDTLMKQLLGQMAPQVAETARDIKIEIAEDGTYKYDRVTGLMTQVDLTRQVTIGSLVRKDTWELKLTTAPKR